MGSHWNINDENRSDYVFCRHVVLKSEFERLENMKSNIKSNKVGFIEEKEKREIELRYRNNGLIILLCILLVVLGLLFV